MLFQIDITGTDPEEVVRQFWLEQEAEEESRRFAERLVHGVRLQMAELDRRVAGVAEHWRLERMPVVDRNVLRIAVYELLNDPETPSIVIIDEAIEIGKKFGSGESGGFINGLLDSIRTHLEQERIRPPGRNDSVRK